MIKTLLLASFALLALAAAPAAQYAESDPRFESDPRDVEQDPRDAERDPRDVALEEENKQFAVEVEADLETRDLFEKLFDAGRDDELSAAMAERPWEVLDSIDSAARAWRKLVERDAAKTDPVVAAEAADLAEKARRLARLADRGIGDSGFEAWVDALVGWTPEQRAQDDERARFLNEARTILEEAESEDEFLVALTPLQRSLEAARELGDVRGQAIALATIGRIEAIHDMRQEAQVDMGEAVRLGRSVRDLDATWDGLSIIYEVSILDGSYEVARDTLRDQYQISLELGADDTSDELIARMISLDDLISGEPSTINRGLRRGNPWLRSRNPIFR